jgi:predicted CopG family antitoxin
MKKIEIQTDAFFELLKSKNLSMWDIFAQMLQNEEQEIIFINPEQQVLFNYILPNNLEKLKEDQNRFSEEFKNKISNLYKPK